MKTVRIVIPALIVIVGCTGIADAATDAAAIVRDSGIRAGLCVILDVNDGSLAVELAGEAKFVVHGLALTQQTADAATKAVASRGLLGPVSVEQGPLGRLPYVDNLVNLVVVEDLDKTRRAGLDVTEIVRALCPGGVAFLGGAKDAAGLAGVEVAKTTDAGVFVRKLRPKGSDDWTHWLHGPECNNLSEDSLTGPAARLQWHDGPIWLSGGNVTEVFADGKGFNVLRDKDGNVRITGRDACNGLVLWQHDVKMGGQEFNPRTILAVGDRVYVSVKPGEPLVALDAATGETVKTYDLGFAPMSVLYVDGCLLIGGESQICSVNAKTGEVRWRIPAPKDATFILSHTGPGPQVLYKPPYMVAGDGRLLVYVKDAPKPPWTLVAYDVKTGEERWRVRQPGEVLAYYQKVLMLYEVIETSKPGKGNEAEKGVYHAISFDGKRLWDNDHSRGDYHGVWDDPLYAAGFIWMGNQSIDPVTGEKGRRLKNSPGTGHCARYASTDSYLIGKMTIFIDIAADKRFGDGHYKNGCNVGQVPANGMIYTFPIHCSCINYIRGYVAFAPNPGLPRDEDVERLVRGPAYGTKSQPGGKPEWNTYRRDNRRSGVATETLPQKLDLLWSETVAPSERAPYGKRITPPVVAEGMVFAAATDGFELRALDATTGKMRWSRPLSGRVEAPPTVWRGLCYFGTSDGWAWCLRASDGEVVWRFRAAPAEQRIMVRGRLESTWPVPCVLIENGLAYFVAGRHSRSDGGLTVYAVDALTGKVAWEKRVNRTNEETWYDNNANDLLVSDGEKLFLCQQMFDLKTGERSRTWNKKQPTYVRDYLISGNGRDTSAVFPFGFLYDRNEGAESASRYDSTHWFYRGAKGLMLSFTDDRIFGVTASRSSSAPWIMFARKPMAPGMTTEDTAVWFAPMERGSVRALLPAGSVLFVAASGPKGEGGMLSAWSAADGNRISETPFDDRPVFDGMAAANGRLYLCTLNGKVLCFGEKE